MNSFIYTEKKINIEETMAAAMGSKMVNGI
jgi:hypothetical protein